MNTTEVKGKWNAAKENFLFKGYFNRRKKAAEKITKDSLDVKMEEQKVIDDKN